VKIAILGTGMVGAALGTKLVQQKQEVMMGSRTANNDGAQKWLQSVGGNGQIGTFAEAAAFGEIALDCTNGANALAALRLAGMDNLRDKILIQVGNPLDFSKGMPPSLTVCNTDSLGEQTQREFPETRVVKAPNLWKRRAGQSGSRQETQRMVWMEAVQHRGYRRYYRRPRNGDVSPPMAAAVGCNWYPGFQYSTGARKIKKNPVESIAR
jgi:predicted dinucleotide-binding enzyme